MTRRKKFALALSVRQPHAERILSGKKLTERRNTATSVRGRVYIYASYIPADPKYWRQAGYLPGELPTGVLVGTVKVVGWKHHRGKYLWLLAHPRRLAKLRKPGSRPKPVWFRPFN